jgi:hypothetical protein
VTVNLPSTQTLTIRCGLSLGDRLGSDEDLGRCETSDRDSLASVEEC